MMLRVQIKLMLRVAVADVVYQSWEVGPHKSTDNFQVIVLVARPSLFEGHAGMDSVWDDVLLSPLSFGIFPKCRPDFYLDDCWVNSGQFEGGRFESLILPCKVAFF